MPDTKSEHTPFPWDVECVSDCVRIVAGSGRGKIVIARLAPKQLSETETTNNARFILRAATHFQTMKDAMKSALRESGCDGDLCCHEWHEVFRKVIAEVEEP